MRSTSTDIPSNFSYALRYFSSALLPRILLSLQPASALLLKHVFLVLVPIHVLFVFFVTIFTRELCSMSWDFKADVNQKESMAEGLLLILKQAISNGRDGLPFLWGLLGFSHVCQKGKKFCARPAVGTHTYAQVCTKKHFKDITLRLISRELTYQHCRRIYSTVKYGENGQGTSLYSIAQLGKQPHGQRSGEILCLWEILVPCA